MRLSRLALVLVLAAAATASGRAQDWAQKPAPQPAPHGGDDPDAPVVHAPISAGDADVHEQMKQLIGEIERGLRRIDELLSKAADAPRAASGKPAPAAVREFVQESQAEGQRVVQGIDRLLELADHPHPPGGA